MIRYYETTALPAVAGMILPLLLLFSLYLSPVHAQSHRKIPGKILSQDGSSLPYVSVRLQKEDGELIKGTL